MEKAKEYLFRLDILRQEHTTSSMKNKAGSLNIINGMTSKRCQKKSKVAHAERTDSSELITF